MQVVKIISKSKEYPLYFWKMISDIDSKSTFIDYDQIDRKTKDTIDQDIIRYGNGFLISHNGTIYLITCNHIVHDNYETYFYIKGMRKQYKTRKLFDICEMDMSILIPDDQIELARYSARTDLLYESLNITGHLTILTTNNLQRRASDIVNKNETDFEISEIKGKFDKLIFEKCNSLFFQKVPMISIDIYDAIDKDSKLSGLSGSIVINSDNKICGYISNFSKKLMQMIIIPSHLIMYIFEMISDPLLSFDGGLKSLYLETQLCTFSAESMRRTGHYITNNYNIKYKLFESKKLFTFPLKSVMYKINDRHFDEKGYVVCSDTLSLPLDTYLLLNNNIQYHIITYSDTIKKITEHIKIIPSCLTNNLTVDIYSNHKIAIYKGLVFMELSEELLKHLHDTGIDIIGEAYNRYTN